MVTGGRSGYYERRKINLKQNEILSIPTDARWDKDTFIGSSVVLN